MTNHLLPTILAGIILATFSSTVWGHGLCSEKVGPTAIRFTYDDGEPMSDGYVCVYDSSGKEIAKGQANDDGVFDYSKYPTAEKITIGDTHGHQMDHSLSDPTSDKINPAYKYSIILLVVTGLLVISLFFNGKMKKKTA